MKCGVVVLVLVLVAAATGFAQTGFTGSGDFSGMAVLRFTKTTVTAELDGALRLSGVLPIGDGAVFLDAEGEIVGAGEGDMASLTGVAWMAFIGRGTLQNGEKVVVRGGLTADDGDFLISVDAEGEGTGRFFLMIVSSETRHEFTGSTRGVTGGSFVPPDDPSTMQLIMSGTMEFVSTSSVSNLRSDPIEVETLRRRLPWDLGTWPGGLAEHLVDLLVGSSPEPE